jgi:hypothetical protein
MRRGGFESEPTGIVLLFTGDFGLKGAITPIVDFNSFDYAT